jgi:hypothetical protein
VRADGNCLLYAVNYSFNAKYQTPILDHGDLRTLAATSAKRYTEKITTIDGTTRSIELADLETASQRDCITYPASFIIALATAFRGDIHIWGELDDRPQTYSPQTEMIPQLYVGPHVPQRRNIHLLHRCP